MNDPWELAAVLTWRRSTSDDGCEVVSLVLGERIVRTWRPRIGDQGTPGDLLARAQSEYVDALAATFDAIDPIRDYDG